MPVTYSNKQPFKSLMIKLLCLLMIASTMAQTPVLISNMETLTFHKDMMTTGQRYMPRKQMQCVGDYCHSHVMPSSMQCNNTGFDGKDANWKCCTQLPAAYKLGKVNISCEGFSYPGNKYALQGSCGVNYTIEESGAYVMYYNTDVIDNNDRNEIIDGVIISLVTFVIYIFIIVICIRGCVNILSNMQ